MTFVRRLLLGLLVFGAAGGLFLLAMVLGGQASPGVVIGVVGCLVGAAYLAYKLRHLSRGKKA